MPSNHVILCCSLLYHPQSLPVPESFPMSKLVKSGGQSVGASASASVLPMNIQGWFPLGLTDLLAVQGTRKNLLQHHSSKASILEHSAFFIVQLWHPHMTTGKAIALTIWTISQYIMLGLCIKKLTDLVPTLQNLHGGDGSGMCIQSTLTKLIIQLKSYWVLQSTCTCCFTKA